MFVSNDDIKSIIQRNFVVMDICKHNKLSGKTGLIASPNYPKSYYSLLNCVLKIEAPVGATIHIGIKDFNMQTRTVLGTCSDMLKVSNTALCPINTGTNKHYICKCY